MIQSTFPRRRGWSNCESGNARSAQAGPVNYRVTKRLSQKLSEAVSTSPRLCCFLDSWSGVNNIESMTETRSRAKTPQGPDAMYGLLGHTFVLAFVHCRHVSLDVQVAC